MDIGLNLIEAFDRVKLPQITRDYIFARILEVQAFALKEKLSIYTIFINNDFSVSFNLEYKLPKSDDIKHVISDKRLEDIFSNLNANINMILDKLKPSDAPKRIFTHE